MGRNLAWLGVVLFAVSWFVDAHAAQSLGSALGGFAKGMGEMTEGLRTEGGAPGATVTGDMPTLDYGGPPGWQACRYAFDLLTGAQEGGKELKGDNTKRLLLGATSLTNLVMLLALLLLFLKLGGVPRWLGLLLLLCAGLNLGWLYHTEADFRDGLRLGYWLWTGSFVLVGISSLMATQDD